VRVQADIRLDGPDTGDGPGADLLSANLMARNGTHQSAFFYLSSNGNAYANAFSDGDAEISVSVDALPDGGTRVQVLDRGRGMSDEVMRQALLPFYSTKQAGSGVGLPLCREIIEAHGGSLRIQNRTGGGTIVSFWLPSVTTGH